MSGSITTHFTEEFNQELFVAFQNKGGYMRGKTRRKTGVIGYRTHFPKIASAPAAQQKTRRGKVPVMDISRSRVYCDLADYYGADYVDDLDQLKTNVQEKQAIQNAIVMSLARTEDQLIAAQLIAGSNTNDVTGSDDSWSSDATPRSVMEAFGRAEAMQDGQMYAAVTWRAWNDSLAFLSFIHSDYGGDPAQTAQGGTRPKIWFGFEYKPWSALPTHTASAKPYNIWWNMMCIGEAVGKEITPSTTWQDDYDAYFVKGKMSLGAKLVDDTGVIKRRYTA